MHLPDIDATCQALSSQLQTYLETYPHSNPMIIGIRTGGVWVAQHLINTLNLPEPLYSVDISFYRDDFNQKGLNPKVCGSELPESLENRHIILVDDVIMSGRTVRAAINELFDYGRPASITLACLLDVGQRELPIQPDVCGARLTLQPGQLIKLSGPEPMTLNFV
ncbi:MAG: bifunctional pyr operon transcriptional regulator/uracil phosphoribosyltransferase PyrR [Oceanobacter sp.]